MNIAKLNAVLTANANPMVGVIGRAKSSLTSYAADAAKATASAASSIAGFTSAAAVGVAGLWQSFRDGIDDLVRVDDTARHLGLTVAELQGAIVWSGKSAGEMTAALAVTQGKLLEVATGGVAATAELDNLAAVSGLTADRIKGAGWSGVYDAIGRIADPTQRAAQAFRYLGSDATKFLDALKGGGSRDAARVAKGFGMAAGTGDVDSARKIVETLGYIDALKQGFFNQVLTGLAPVVAELMSMFDLTKVNLEWIKPLVVEVAQGAAMFGAFIVEATKSGEVFWAGMDAGISTFKEGMVAAVREVAEEAKKLFAGTTIGGAVGAADKIGLFGWAVPTEEKTLIGPDGKPAGAPTDAASKRKAFGDMLNLTDSGKGVASFFDRVRDRMKDLGKASREAMAPFQIDKLQKKFAGLQQAVGGPLAAFRQSAADLMQYEKLGLTKGSDVGNRGAFQMASGLIGAAGLGGPAQLAGAAAFNSREAYSTEAQFKAEGQRGTVQERMLTAIEYLKARADRENEIGADVLRELKRLNADKATRI